MGALVAVVGASGYVGGELLRLLAGHPDLELAAVTADNSAGKTVGELHPQLAGNPSLAGLVLRPHEAAALADCDLVFLALPAGQSADIADMAHAGTKIVDLGPDFRLADPDAWNRHYGGRHAGHWVTGIPELPGARAQIRQTNEVAAPGCYATAAILALVPLVSAGLADPADVVIVAASGTSGAGRAPRADLMASEVLGSVSAYQVGGAHRHTPEIEQALTTAVLTRETTPDWLYGPAASRGASAPGQDVLVSFTPLLVPMARGILATCTARLADDEATTDLARDVLIAAYAREPFVTVLPEGSWPATSSVAGSNGAHLQAAVDTRVGRAVAMAAIDNLGKGAAGQAVQNANIMLGLPETAGLTAIGVAP
jgi:N-acetyl-gamma-glutamyl-phosphate reductase